MAEANRQNYRPVDISQKVVEEDRTPTVILEDLLTDMMVIQYSGNPEGNVEADPTALCVNIEENPAYPFAVKSSGTGSTGWLRMAEQRSGTGSPESVEKARIGTLFHRTDGGVGTYLYIKQTGDNTNTGWVAI